MTDRVSVLTVVLDRDYRSDDVQVIVKAVEMIKGVLRVGTDVVEVSDFVARSRARMELEQKLWDALKS